ncbi:hypothetical protein SRB5_20280 [Streptomyces sp. RB5]|uniref:Uncharacterized protein n=1 Tax=Streptomyces smaragdinus TaxID=2585196 RepID=A0A7K0CEL4_9ACTN|nr:AAA family ATPase [Streptomyces smaragdinus]MQY11909.1 hypothetical protein [Streptomyces smaragdinus]
MRSSSRPRGTSARWPAPGNLPAELNRFVGRAPELAELGRLLSDARLVTVTGAAGVGKSRLALHAANAVQKRFGNGVWLVDLSALRDEELLPHAVLDALGRTDAPGVRGPVERLLARLAGRRLLLVLDGCEHLAAPCARLVAELLRHSPGLTVLATSRRTLDAEGERLLPLLPLPVDTPQAAELFDDRAAAVLPGYDAGAHREDVLELCRRLDGIPLALELAAGRLRALSVGQILQRLDDRFRLLAGAGHGAPPRHRTLRTAVGWSHELCLPAERLLWARLSVFAGDFDLDAVEYLCADDDPVAEDVLGALEELVAQSVVIREESHGRTRYRMLPTLREYGACWLERLEPAPARLRRRHRDWYLGLATWCELDWFGPRQTEVVGRVEEELPNIRLALEFCLETPEEAHVGQYLAATLWFYWVACGRLAEGRHWLERTLEVPGALPEPHAKALWVAGYLATQCGETVAALTALEQCRRLAAAVGDERADAYAVQMLGVAAAMSDDMPRAVTLLRRALERFRAIGEFGPLVLLAQVQLATAVSFGDVDEAVLLHREARDIARESGERWAQAYALNGLAHALWRRGGAGDAEGAHRYVREGLALHASFHDVLGMAYAVDLLAVQLAGEDAALAARLQGAAAGARRSLGPERFGAWHFTENRRGAEQRAREALGDVRYEEESALGRERGLPALVYEVLDTPCPADRACCPPASGAGAGPGAVPSAPAPRLPGQRA